MQAGILAGDIQPDYTECYSPAASTGERHFVRLFRSNRIHGQGFEYSPHIYALLIRDITGLGMNQHETGV